MIVVGIFAVVILAFIAGVDFTLKSVGRHITRADICSDDKRFIRDVLGIPQ